MNYDSFLFGRSSSFDQYVHGGGHRAIFYSWFELEVFLHFKGGLTRAKDNYYQIITCLGGTDGFMSYTREVVQLETQTASSWI